MSPVLRELVSTGVLLLGGVVGYLIVAVATRLRESQRRRRGGEVFDLQAERRRRRRVG